MHMHEDYSEAADSSPHKDVCILETTSNILEPRSAACQNKLCTATPCIPKSDFVPGSRCWVAGWGADSPTGRGQNWLQQAGLNSLSFEYCKAKSWFSQYYSYMKEQDELCAYTPDRDRNGYLDPGTDICRGDSGGPLICERDGKPELTGIVSWGKSCGIQGKPGIYVNVFKMRDWIEDKVIQIERKQRSTGKMLSYNISISNAGKFRTKMACRLRIGQ